MKTCRILALVCLYCLPLTVYCQQILPEFKAKTISIKNPELEKRFRAFTNVKLETGKLAAFLRGKQLSNFRLHVNEVLDFEVTLEPSHITSSNYKLKSITPGGLITISSDVNYLYQGKTKGGGEVRLAIKEGFIYGIIANKDKEYFIQPHNLVSSKAEKDEYIIYETKDIIQNQELACGVNNDQLQNTLEQQNNFRNQRIQGSICKKIKFISVADYSIYQKFNNDVYAVEQSLLANLNLAEGAFKSLNFGIDGSTDVGADELHFEMEEIVVPICLQCDIVRSDENVGTVTGDFEDWIRSNHTNSTSKIFQFWTTRSLFLNNGGVVGYTQRGISCSSNGETILKYASDDPAFLRVLVAHETGHALGCDHDNAVKADVSGFIMYSGASGAMTRFSTLADFGGVAYSSQQTIRNRILQNFACLEDCVTLNCEPVEDLKVNYFNSFDSIQISWRGTGKFFTKYKVSDSLTYENGAIKEVAGNSIILKNLYPCTLYSFSVQNICPGDSNGKVSSIIFNSSSLNTHVKSTRLHGDLYDLELAIDCKYCLPNQYSVKVDHDPINISSDTSFSTITLKDLFADGARHKLEITKDSNSKDCINTLYFQAPYFRNNSQKILGSDFNTCSMPVGWKDSVLLINQSFSRPFWFLDLSNFYTTRTARGTFDSSCMLYYNSFSNAYRGTLALITPIIDLTNFRNISLHFDFNFLSYKAPNGFDFGSFWVEVFNGNNWEKILDYTQNEPYPRNSTDVKNIWENIPQRINIDLDKYKNKRFQIRFIIDDGLMRYNRSGQVFTALDNIQIDGYPEEQTNTDFIIYPNPTREDVSILFTQSILSGLTYNIVDLNGRVIKKGSVQNYRISLKELNAGIYFIRLYQNSHLVGKLKKLIKY